ncbi:hypothetical protein [Terrihabitans rhizophilus]|uniref:Uncharacterized protein n=1 Tax=Terrihabitans rhizophilus TaxID=3092662 RepID=A0ABU4RU30_9HYPH|nr:hypothetical protein [Terrihabitans sp. PJ23]MDX6806341.1 hypothetical protein [Terrihabitans sp. PJ23]
MNDVQTTTAKATAKEEGANCPVTSLLRLVNEWSEEHDRLDCLGKAGATALNECWRENAQVVLMERVLSAPLAMAYLPARSLEGAVSKLMIAATIYEDLPDEDENERFVREQRFIAASFLADATRYFVEAHGIDFTQTAVNRHLSMRRWPDQAIAVAKTITDITVDDDATYQKISGTFLGFQGGVANA